MWILFAGGLLTLSLTDLKKRVIPNGILAVLVLNRAVWVLLRQPVLPAIREMMPGLGTAVVLLTIVRMFERIWQQKILGGGDQKLMLVLALYLDQAALLLAVFLGCLMGTLVKWIRIDPDVKRARAVPLGPFLSVGAALALFLSK